MIEKPTYKELEKRSQELENIESENKHFREALQEKESLFRRLYEKAPLGYQSLDENGHFIVVNQTWLDTLGYTNEDVIGKSFSDFLHPDWRDHFKENFPRFKSIGEVLGVEFEMVKKNGDLILVSFTGKISRDKIGNFQQTHCIFHDITAQKQAEDKLKRIEWMLSRKPFSEFGSKIEKYNSGYDDLTELNRDGIILKSIGRERLKGFADDYLELIGTSSAIYELNGDYAFGIFASGWCQMMDRASRKLCDTGDNVKALKSGRWLCHESCWTDCSQKAIEKREPVDIACNGGIRLYAVPIFAGKNVIGSINFGYGDPPKDPQKLNILADLYHLKYDDLFRGAKTYDSRPPYIIEMAKKRLKTTAKLIGSMVESTQAMEALRENENQISSIFRSAPVGIGSVVNRVLNKVNDRLCEMTGYSESELIGQSARKLYPSDKDFEFVGQEKYAQIADHGTGTVETRWRKKDGTIMDVLLSSTPVDLQDQSKGVTFTSLDITDRKQAEKELNHAHEKILTILESIDATVYVADMDTSEILFMNKRMINDFGGDKTGDICYSAFRNNSEPCECCTNKQLVDEDGNPTGVRVWDDKNPVTGRYYINYDRAIEWTDGRVVRMQIATDITDLKKMESQLLQAHKMESVGRLAGGVAHDFNNMLNIILGNTEMAIEDIAPDDPVHGNLGEILSAAKRSADITRQLLAFSRKQTIAPKVLNLNDTIESMFRMLRRLIGEDIDLVWRPGANIRQVRMDPSQIDQILANLCVNARDAIADVGKITIETGNTTFDSAYCETHQGFNTGDFVLLAVSDDGCGMDKDTMKNMFEPFYTTKGVGKGTGLGLATVYGIVKQNEGFINVYSEPDQGTTFRIYLPQYRADTKTPEKKTADKIDMDGNETILLVEDEPSILRMTRMMLERSGYKILAASTPGEAVSIAREHTDKIHLLMTDVVMPEMNGRDLAKKILSLHPNLKRLFMSGYTANVIAHHGILDEGVNFIQKPFSKQDLAIKIREVLDQD
ncbi:PAS domain S-box protein [Desulfobacter curvatus]|uniref:PAS domain S-box protein n=1 Tax=Desulfobacter curvatus TaxID=2290 RepID=UPI00036EB39C|nr:PAS domain S-box protein [Desulfobacter curvatus]